MWLSELLPARTPVQLPPDRDGEHCEHLRGLSPSVPLFLGVAQFSISLGFVLIDSMYFLYIQRGNLYLPITFILPGLFFYIVYDAFCIYTLFPFIGGFYLYFLYKHRHTLTVFLIKYVFYNTS